MALSVLYIEPNSQHPYMSAGKIIALIRWTFVNKVMSLLYDKLFRLVITFLPRSKRLLIPWLQLPSAVILKPHKNKVYHCFYCFRKLVMVCTLFGLMSRLYTD